MNQTNPPLNVGVLSLHNSKETKAIINAIADLGHTPVWLREENIVFAIDEGNISLSPDVDIVVNRLLLTKAHRPIEDLELATAYQTHRPMLNSPGPTLTAIHKYATALTLAGADIPVPESLFALNHAALTELRKQLAEPAVQKTAIGTNGSGVWDVAGGDELLPTVAGRRTILQQFLDAGDRPHDLRVYVVDGTVIGAMRRYAPAGDWRANVARGGETEDVTEELPSEASRVAKAATATIGLDYAGVDLMKQDGTWYVLEVNPTAGFKGLFDATGTSVAPFIAQLAIEQAGGDVSPERVAALATTLDDAVPACKPRPPDESTKRSTVGYTEEVTVSGTSQFTTVIAKADTGAKRTSLDLSLAGEIEAGPIKSKTEVRSGSQKGSASRPLVDIELGVRGQWQTITASVEDRAHMEYPLLLGRDVLEGHRIDLQRRVDEE